MKDVLARIKEVAEKIDWKCLLDIQPVKQNKQLELHLIGCFNEELNRFMINGVPIDIKPLVQPIVGLPNEGNEVKRAGKFEEDLFVLFTAEGKSIPAKDGIKKFLNNGVNERFFFISFVLAAMGYIFGPKANRCLDREYLPFFFGLRVDDLKNLKWCDLIADLLIEEIKKFIASESQFKKCGGCLLVPVNMFYDLVTAKESRGNGFPRANDITQTNLGSLRNFKELEKRVTFKAVEELYEFYGLGKPTDPVFKKYQDRHAREQTRRS